MRPIRFETGHSWNALPADSYCCGVGGARSWRFWPVRWRFSPRRPTISSRSASFPFRFWSGCSTARPPSARPASCAGCVRHSRSAGGSASAISSPGCGGSAAPCWSRPKLRLGAADRRRLAAGHPRDLLRPGGGTGAAVLDRRYRPHRRTCRLFRAVRMAPHLHLHGLSLESGRLCARCRRRC